MKLRDAAEEPKEAFSSFQRTVRVNAYLSQVLWDPGLELDESKRIPGTSRIAKLEVYLGDRVWKNAGRVLFRVAIESDLSKILAQEITNLSFEGSGVLREATKLELVAERSGRDEREEAEVIKHLGAEVWERGPRNVVEQNSPGEGGVSHHEAVYDIIWRQVGGDDGTDDEFWRQRVQPRQRWLICFALLALLDELNAEVERCCGTKRSDNLVRTLYVNVTQVRHG